MWIYNHATALQWFRSSSKLHVRYYSAVNGFIRAQSIFVELIYIHILNQVNSTPIPLGSHCLNMLIRGYKSTTVCFPKIFWMLLIIMPVNNLSPFLTILALKVYMINASFKSHIGVNLSHMAKVRACVNF